MDEPIRSHADADKRLGDTEYLVYLLVQMMRFFIAMAGKRWPHVK